MWRLGIWFFPHSDGAWGRFLRAWYSCKPLSDFQLQAPNATSVLRVARILPAACPHIFGNSDQRCFGGTAHVSADLRPGTCAVGWSCELKTLWRRAESRGVRDPDRSVLHVLFAQ